MRAQFNHKQVAKFQSEKLSIINLQQRLTIAQSTTNAYIL